MLRSVGYVLAATLSFAALAAETPPVADGVPAQAIALNTHREPVAAATRTFDDYTGVYAAVDGTTFVVVRVGDSLAIELPESLSLPVRAADGTSFVVDASAMRIAFETDHGGRLCMLVSRPSGEPIVATRVPLPRGVVTIQDI